MQQTRYDEIATAVQALVREYAPGLDSSAPLPDDLRLASGGLDFDSVRVVELLLTCEQRFGIAIPAELLDGAALTVGTLVALVRRGRAAPP
jgi:acyl carrier protein